MNKIDKTAIIGDNVIMGDNNTVLPYTIIYDGVKIGNNNYIGSHVVIGSPATDTKGTNLELDDISVFIGDDNIIREFCVIEKPCYEKKTIIGNNVFLMQGVHLSHDIVIEDKVVVTNLCVVAGIVKVLEGANLGMACTINQRAIIGQYSIVATGASCMKNVKPFSRYIPKKPISVNNYAINKYGFNVYKLEITDYVLYDIEPKSKCISQIVNHFNTMVKSNSLDTYK